MWARACPLSLACTGLIDQARTTDTRWLGTNFSTAENHIPILTNIWKRFWLSNAKSGRLGIHSDKIWTDSNTRNTLKSFGTSKKNSHWVSVVRGLYVTANGHADCRYSTLHCASRAHMLASVSKHAKWKPLLEYSLYIWYANATTRGAAADANAQWWIRGQTTTVFRQVGMPRKIGFTYTNRKKRDVDFVFKKLALGNVHKWRPTFFGHICPTYLLGWTCSERITTKF